MMLSIPSLLPLRRLQVGITREDGSRTERNFINNGEGALVEQPAAVETPSPDEQGPTLELVPETPALVLEPVSITDFVNLLTTARAAVRSLDHYVQLRDPSGSDLRTLERLRAALSPFFPEQPPAA